MLQATYVVDLVDVLAADFVPRVSTESSIELLRARPKRIGSSMVAKSAD